MKNILTKINHMINKLYEVEAKQLSARAVLNPIFRKAANDMWNKRYQHAKASGLISFEVQA